MALVCGATELSGKWIVTAPSRDGNQITMSMVIRAEGNSYAGTISGEEGDATMSAIKLDGSDLTFNIDTDDATYHVKATVDGDKMKGSYEVGQSRGGTFTAEKQK